MKSAISLLDEFENENKRASASMKDIAKGAGVFRLVELAVSKLESSVGDAVDRFDTLTRYPKVMKQIGFDADVSNRSIQKLSDGIKGLPTSLEFNCCIHPNIAILTGDLEKATDTSLALNNAFLASGSVTADAERGLTQYVQMLSKAQWICSLGVPCRKQWDMLLVKQRKNLALSAEIVMIYIARFRVEISLSISSMML